MLFHADVAKTGTGCRSLAAFGLDGLVGPSAPGRGPGDPTCGTRSGLLGPVLLACAAAHLPSAHVHDMISAHSSLLMMNTILPRSEQGDTSLSKKHINAPLGFGRPTSQNKAISHTRLGRLHHAVWMVAVSFDQLANTYQADDSRASYAHMYGSTAQHSSASAQDARRMHTRQLQVFASGDSAAQHSNPTHLLKPAAVLLCYLEMFSE